MRFMNADSPFPQHTIVDRLIMSCHRSFEFLMGDGDGHKIIHVISGQSRAGTSFHSTIVGKCANHFRNTGLRVTSMYWWPGVGDAATVKVGITDPDPCRCHIATLRHRHCPFPCLSPSSAGSTGSTTHTFWRCPAPLNTWFRFTVLCKLQGIWSHSVGHSVTSDWTV